MRLCCFIEESLPVQGLVVWFVLGSVGGDRLQIVTRLGSSLLLLVLFVVHETDEDRREEHEDEGLQEGHEQFEERQKDGEDPADQVIVPQPNGPSPAFIAWVPKRSRVAMRMCPPSMLA